MFETPLLEGQSPELNSRRITPDAPKTPEQPGIKRSLQPIQALTGSDGQLYIQYRWVEGGKTTGPGGKPQFYILPLNTLMRMIDNGVTVVLENDSTENDSSSSDSYEGLRLFLKQQEELARRRELDLLAESVATTPLEVTANTAVPQTGIEELAQNPLPLEEENSELALFETNLQDFLNLVQAYLERGDNNKEEYENIVNRSIEIFKQLAYNDRLSKEFFQKSNELAGKLLNSLLQLEERQLGQLGQKDYIYNFIFDLSVEIGKNVYTSHFFVFVADKLLQINLEKYASILLERWFNQFTFSLDRFEYIQDGKLLDPSHINLLYLVDENLKANLYFLFFLTGYQTFDGVKNQAFESILNLFQQKWDEAIESASSQWNNFASNLEIEIESDEKKLSSLHNEYQYSGNQRSLAIDDEFQAIKKKYEGYLKNTVNLYIENINDAISSLEGFTNPSHIGVNLEVIQNIKSRLNDLLRAINQIKVKCMEITEKNLRW